jgi:DNA-3-methyladenine glycosylase
MPEKPLMHFRTPTNSLRLDELMRCLEEEPPHLTAPRLLGWRLVSVDGLEAELVEVEAYGPEDPGSHSFRGMTPRNGEMFSRPGRAYVYLSYGVHWLLNVSALPEGAGAAILLRAARPLDGLNLMRERRGDRIREQVLLSGPGRLSKAFALGPSHNGRDLFDSSQPIHLIPPKEPGPITVLAGPRIGLAEGKGDLEPWRFVWGEKLRWASPGRKGLVEVRTGRPDTGLRGE